MSGSSRRYVAAFLSSSALLSLSLVTVLSAPAGAATVNDEASFTTAWQTAGTTQIDLGGDITLTCTSGEPTRSSTTAITLNGNGHTLTQTCAGDRVLEQQDSGMVTLSNITVTGGDADGDGGALDTPGDVVVTGSVIAGNASNSEGGAFEVNGDLSVTGSLISDNTAAGSGGAIAGHGVTTLTDSTMTGNSSGNNGGAIRSYGSAVVINSTISGNTAVSDGGAISNNNDTTLVYATVVDNTGSFGGNLDLGGSPLASFGSVVALPHGSTDCSGGSGTTSTGYNTDDDGTCGFKGTGDRSDFTTPLGLGALAANGGLAPTRLPAASSPLLEQIPAAACGGGQGITADERGVARPQGLMCDVGAVELAAASPASTTTTTAPPAAAPAAVTVTPAFTG